MAGGVRCGACAFLSLRDRHTGEYREADAGYREAGAVAGPLRDRVDISPVCFVMAADLSAEASGHQAPDAARRTLAVIGRDRECGKFAPVMIGYTPKEVADMTMQDVLLKAANDRAEERIREDRAWRESQEAKAAERRQQQEKEAARRQKERDEQEWRRKILLTLAGIALSGVFTLVGYWFKGFVDRQVNEARQQVTPPVAPAAK